MKPIRFVSGIIFLALIFIISSAHAQDLIIKKNKEEIKAKVLEIGLEEIKYKLPGNEDGPAISIAKEEVWKIKFENGTEWLNAPDPYSASPATEVRDHARAVKFEFFSPLFGKLAFGYEQMVKVGINMEFKLGIIGPSISKEITSYHPRGVFVKLGPKFLLGSEYVTRNLKYAHPLAGKYFKPEIIFSTFGRDGDLQPGGLTTDRYSATSFAINLVYGKQSIVGNLVTVDWYFGVGYGTQSTTKKIFYLYPGSNVNFESYCFSHLYTGPEMPLVFTCGITVGVLMK